MPKFNVTFNVLGSFTMGVEADDEDAAYDAATDAFFEGMDRSGIEYEIQNRELEIVVPSDAEGKIRALRSPHPTGQMCP